jgi:zinc protease
LASSVLGGGFTSRLMEEIRQNRGLSYGVHARFSSFLRGGEFAISTFTKNETVKETLQVTLDVTRKLAEDGPREDELARTKTFLKGLYPLELETHEQIARTLADIRLYGLGDDHVSRLRERIQAVTSEQVRQVARAHFPLEAFTLVCVGPARLLKKELATFGPKVAVKKLVELE